MKRLLIILVLMLTSILTSAQEISNFELEYYSLEEIQKFINQEIAYMSNPDYRHGGYWCNVPLEIACQIFPFLRHEFEPLPPSKTPDIENLVPFHSLVDLEKVQTHLEPYVLKTTTLGFLNNGQGPVDKAYMEQKVQSSDFETWNDYILDQAQEEFKRNLYTVLVDYGDGFLMPDIYYNNSWSNLKNSFSSIEYDSYPREMYPRYYLDEPNLGITKEKAETLLGGSASLIRTVHSLYIAKTDFNYENYSNTPDEYIWVNGANAIGFGSKKHYQIVDEFGQPLNLLEDKVETRITTISASGIDVLDIQVLFNLIVIDE